MKVDNTFRVSGLPKCTCGKRDIYRLFSSVAQIENVWISREKKWTINGCILNLSKHRSRKYSFEKQSPIKSSSKTSLAPLKNAKANQKSINPVDRTCLCTYKDYKNGRNTFWEDVPHHKSSAVLPRNIQQKKKRQYIRYVMPNLPIVQTCKKRKKLTKQKKGKRKKKFKQINSAAYENCLLVRRNGVTVTNEAHRDSKQAYSTNSSEFCDVSQTEQFAKDIPLVTDMEMNQTESIRLQFHQHGLYKDPGINEYAGKQNGQFSFFIPVHIYSNDGVYLFLSNSTNPLQSIKDEILRKQRIPKRLQHVIYEGHALQPHQSVIPYSSVHVIVKGKGGMKEDGDNKEMFGDRVEKTCSEEEVQHWLKDTVKVQAETLQLCQDLDGDLLYDFPLAEYKKFAHELHIPIGQAFRILYHRDKPASFENAAPYIKHWSVGKVKEFVQNTVKGKEDQEKICKVVVKDQIDGLLLCHDSSLDDFHLLFLESNCKELIVRKLFKKRNLILDQEETERKSTMEGTMVKSNEGQDEIVKGKENLSVKIDSAKQISLKEYCLYVDKMLCLIHCESRENCTECKLLMLCKHDWSSLNALEEKFIFFVLCKPSDFISQDAVSTLWKRIFKRPMMWISNVLKAQERDEFEETRSPEKVKYRSEELTLSDTVMAKCIMGKELHSFFKFHNSVLLINNRILKDNAEGYWCYLDSSSHPYFFNFDTTKLYWLFDPDDYACGFRNLKLPTVKCGRLEAQGIPISISHESNNSMEHKNEFGDMITSESISGKIIAPFHQTKINSNVDNVKKADAEYLERGMEHSYHQEYLRFEKEEDKSHFIDINAKHNDVWQSSRKFKDKADHVVYHEGNRFVKPQSEGEMSDRCVEYKLFIDKLDLNLMDYFLTETLKFACGCLNSRVNGTIYFGVSDKTQTFNNVTYKHGEITGFPLQGMHDYSVKFTDELKRAIQNSFAADVSTAARHCIGDPVFVEVESKEASSSTFVMEVDVAPNLRDCKDIYFKLNLMHILGSQSKEQGNKGNPHSFEYQGYIRDGSTTKLLKGIAEQLFIRADLPELVKKKQELMASVFQSNSDPTNGCESPVQKLKRLLLRGSEVLDNSFWPILVLSKPTERQKEVDGGSLIQSLKFIRRIKFIAVFDFDDCSNKNGHCKFNRNDEMSILHNERIFSEHSGQHSTLQEKLDLPRKTVWIFANGRSDMPEPRAYLRREDWMPKYWAGISDAIAFFSNDNVIQRHRNLVIVLLFSTNFDGLYDTFTDLVRRFHWEKLVIIAQENSVFQEFEKMLTKYYQTGFTERLKDRSVIGVPWKHINAIMNELTGLEEDFIRYVPTSCGAQIQLEERFENYLSDLQVLGSKECEYKEFEDAQKRIHFARKKELDFYKGNKVSWWNFFFENHVLKRTKYVSLKEKVNRILSTTKDSKVVTLTLAHEPGAGGTTLARHVLWEFKDKYRCALVSKITDNTYRQILSFRTYEESESPKPVLLVVDEIEQSDILWDDLERKLYTESRNIRGGIVCCMIVLQREENLYNWEDSPSSESHSRRYIEYLQHRLDKKEQEWLEDKYAYLEHKLMDFKAEHLFSFMIMRSGFNQVYIKTTIKHVLRCLDLDSSEFRLLKYTSLISTYAPCARSGPKPYIPLECCDLLMGFRESKVRSFDNWWEQRLSNVLKILLIIEDKHNASGKSIRISHSLLSEVILSEVMSLEESTLNDLVIEYLNSSLFQTSTHGRKVLIEISKEMLVRRMKEEYDDDVTTSFSPLIEEIKKLSADNAEDVLVLAFKQFDDPMIAQSLARLLVKRKKYDEAIKWAKDAVRLSPKVAFCYCYHTLGSVLKEKFISSTTEFTDLNPAAAIPYLRTIQEALNSFLDAVREVMYGQDNQVLYSYVDIILTVNLICRFTTQSVSLECGRENFKRYFVERNYIPEELEEVWKDFHQMFKCLQQTGEKIFEVLERYINFNATFYERPMFHEQKRLEHRSYRVLRYRYPEMLEDFARTFGCDNDNVPPSEFQSDHSKNFWHRQRVLRLKGNSYYTIFDTLGKSKRPGSTVTRDMALTQFRDIKCHLTAITEKNTRDMMSLVCVNIALGLLGGPNRDSDSFILSLCQRIIDINKSNVELAHFFTTIILWPSTRFKVERNDELLRKSLKFLSETNKKHNKKQRQRSSVVIKEDRNISQPSTQFFLTDGDGVKSICYRTEIFFKEHPETKAGNNPFWEQNRVKRKLIRLSGHLVYSHNPYIVIENEKQDGYIEIHKVRGGIQDLSSEEPVTFFLGFSTAGPIAYDVRRSNEFNTLFNRMDEDPDAGRVEEYRQKSVQELERLLKHIKELKRQHQSRIMKERDKQLLKDEEDIQTALDLKSNRNLIDLD